MNSSEYSITVNVPVQAAYDQWTRLESYPRFMDGVHDVRRLDEHRTRWVTTIDGVRRDFDAEMVTQLQDQRIAWWSVDEPRRAGSVTFLSEGTACTVVTLTLSWQPSESPVQPMPSGKGATAKDARRAREDLERFKVLVETIVLPDHHSVIRLPTSNIPSLA